MISQELIREIIDRLNSNTLKIFCAESITAGLLASSIASVPGASQVLAGSIVTYDKRVKTAVLGVDEILLESYSAESPQVTTAMCEGARELYPDAGVYIAVTGVASTPITDYEVERAVGQIYVSIWYKELYEFADIITADDDGDTRNSIREKAVLYIFEIIKQIIPDNVVSFSSSSD